MTNSFHYEVTSDTECLIHHWVFAHVSLSLLKSARSAAILHAVGNSKVTIRLNEIRALLVSWYDSRLEFSDSRGNFLVRLKSEVAVIHEIDLIINRVLESFHHLCSCWVALFPLHFIGISIKIV